MKKWKAYDNDCNLENALSVIKVNRKTLHGSMKLGQSPEKGSDKYVMHWMQSDRKCAAII